MRPRLPRNKQTCEVATRTEVKHEDFSAAAPLQSYTTILAIMASVTSLDSDMRKLRMDGNTAEARKEVRIFIEEALGEPLGVEDEDEKALFNYLKDGVALCK
jgi:hypothetical protein